MEQAIEIVRGTTNTFHITVTDASGGLYTPKSGDVLVFGIKKDPKKETELLVKKIISIAAAGTYAFTIDHNDTANLPVGQYWYDVGLQSGGRYLNVIEPSPFFVAANVTKWGDGT